VNLNFRDIKRCVKDGKPYMLQRAIVTHDRHFWMAWKKAPLKNTADKGLVTIKDLVQLRREKIGGYIEFTAYRLKPLSPLCKGFGRFDETYPLRDTWQLLPYQHRAVAQLCQSVVRNGAACDGSDTGIGKTYHALSVCRNLAVRPAIICKKAGIAGWERACTFMHTPSLFIVNWEMAKNGKFQYAVRKLHEYSGGYTYKWHLPPHTILIFDEAHMANNEGSQNCALYMASRGLPSLSLSATFADRVSRLYPLLHVLGAVTREKFNEWMNENGRFVNAYYTEEGISEQSDLKEISRVLYPSFGTRISYNHPEVKTFFPRASYQTLIVKLSKAKVDRQNKAFAALVRRVAELQELGKQAEALVADLRYRQMAELLKADILCDITKNAVMEGHSVCIFVNFRDTLDYISKRLRTRSVVHGGQGRERQGVIDAFQSNTCRHIIAMADAGGTSIDLHDVRGGAPRLSLVCPTYNPVTLKQILGRTRRAKSKTFPVIKLVYAAGTVEEKVAETVGRKIANISALNDGDLYEPDLFNMGFTRKA
jgi:superfamily II DNA or RNA helicase